MIWLLIGCLAGALLVISALRAVGAPTLSPGIIGVTFYIVMGGLGAIAAANNGFVDEGAAHYVLAYPTRPDTMLVFAAVAGALGGGALIAQLVLRHRGRDLPSLASARAELTQAAPGRGVLVAAALPLILEVIGLGPALFHAAEYLQSDGPAAAFKVGGTLAPIGFLAAAYLALQQAPGPRYSGRVLCVLYALVSFSTATRALGMLPVLWLLTVEGLGVGGRPVQRAFRAVWTSGLAYLAFASALVGRGLTSHGLFPYFTHLVHDPGSLWVAPNVVAGNLLFGYPLTSYVIHVAPPIGVHAIQTSINPLPGSMTDWTSIAPLLRAHPFIPFNAIGELFSVSLAVGVIYFAVAGFLFQYAAAALVSASSSRVRLGVALAVLAAAAFFMVTSLEYNTRTVSRTLWLVVALIVLTAAWNLLRLAWRKSLWRPLRRQLVTLRR